MRDWIHAHVYVEVHKAVGSDTSDTCMDFCVSVRTSAVYSELVEQH